MLKNYISIYISNDIYLFHKINSCYFSQKNIDLFEWDNIWFIINEIDRQIILKKFSLICIIYPKFIWFNIMHHE